MTTRFAEGIARPEERDEGLRYRYLGGEASGGLRSPGGTAGPVSVRYTGLSVTLYGGGEAVAVSRSGGTVSRGGTAYLGKDALGSVRSATGAGGAVEERYEYDAFGTPYQGDFSSGLNPGYTGKPYDPATGLYNYGYRDYQPAVARFTTVDPIRDGSNWFAYVNNDPVNWVDLWGLNASDRNNNQILGLTGTQNTLLGVGEMVLGVVLFVGGPVLAGTISTVAPPASTAAFSTVGYTGVIVGGGFIAVGLARVAGGV